MRGGQHYLVVKYGTGQCITGGHSFWEQFIFTQLSVKAQQPD
jgi:hypothetical protein